MFNGFLLVPGLRHLMYGLEAIEDRPRHHHSDIEIVSGGKTGAHRFVIARTLKGREKVAPINFDPCACGLRLVGHHFEVGTQTEGLVHQLLERGINGIPRHLVRHPVGNRIFAETHRVIERDFGIIVGVLCANQIELRA
jgi:hypothetical protein